MLLKIVIRVFKKYREPLNGLALSLVRLLAKLSVSGCSDRCPGVLLQPTQRMSSFQPRF